MYANHELIQERWVGGVRCHAITLMLCHHLGQEKRSVCGDSQEAKLKKCNSKLSYEVKFTIKQKVSLQTGRDRGIDNKK